jgi:2-oxoisovalerate dehydrogenase E2 component (dihydrolipoyl transacylase)
VRDGAIVIRDLMNLSISVDHRVVDGHDAARFVADIKEGLEAPQGLWQEPETTTFGGRRS